MGAKCGLRANSVSVQPSIVVSASTSTYPLVVRRVAGAAGDASGRMPAKGKLARCAGAGEAAGGSRAAG